MPNGLEHSSESIYILTEIIIQQNQKQTLNIIASLKYYQTETNHKERALSDYSLARTCDPKIG
jgi:hypothetical protein